MRRIIPETEIEDDGEKITKKKLMDDLKTVVNDAEELLKKAASDQTREWISAAQAKAKKTLKAANDWLEEEEDAITAQARAKVKATEEYMRVNTWMALGIAATTGFFVSILAVRLGLSVIEGGRRLVTRGLGYRGDGKRLKEIGGEM